MAYTLNDLTLGKTHNLATLTLHETVAGQNRVVHVVIPITQRAIKLTTKQKQKQAKEKAKAALLDAAAAL